MIAAIAAIDERNGLGRRRDLLVKLPIDLQRFRRLTTHAAVLMGRKTYESIGRPLPHRQNIVLTRQHDLHIPGCLCVNTLAEVPQRPLFIIGGGDIYRLCLPYCDTLYLTHIHHTFEEADVFFPAINLDEWAISVEEYHAADTTHLYPFSFVDYRRKTKTLSRTEAALSLPT